MVVLALCTAMLAVPATAYAQGPSYLDEAVQGLQDDNIYISVAVARTIDPGTTLELTEQANSYPINVVALPAEAVAPGDRAAFVAQLYNMSGNPNLVVAFGDDLVATSHLITQAEANEFADEAEAENGTVGEALISYIGKVRTETGEPPPPSLPENPDDTDLSFGWIFVIIMALAVVAAAVSTIIARRRRPVQPSWPAPYEVEASDMAAGHHAGVNDEVNGLLEAMRGHAAGLGWDRDFQDSVIRAINETFRLFRFVTDKEPDRIEDMNVNFAVRVELLNRLLVGCLKTYAGGDAYDNPEKDFYAPTRAQISGYRTEVSKLLKAATVGDRQQFELALATIQELSEKPEDGRHGGGDAPKA